MIYLITAASLSGIGMVVIFGRRLLKVRLMPEGEFLEKFRSSSPIMKGLNDSVLTPAGKYWQSRITPLLYALAERVILKFASLAAKFERTLKRFGDYIHGKSHPKGNGGSKYWNGMNDFKNGLKEE
ncbi:MAG: hypothetical protein GXP44_02425 [bacterium]|nr:hypothetical protein [bacterium]